jgi:hypothetical protein
LVDGSVGAGVTGALVDGSVGAGVAGALVDGTSAGVTGSCFLQPTNRPTQTKPDIAANDNNFFILV